MASIFGLLGLQDTDRSYVNTVGQRVVYEATLTLLGMYNTALALALAVFVQEMTTDFKLRYKLPGGGRMQRRGGTARSGAVRANGQWDVALPLEEFGDQIAGDAVALAYMTMQEYQRHLDTIQIRNTNTVRFEILRRLFNNTQTTFVDPIHGSLTIEPLANGDSVSYPPVEGSETEATDTHYLESGYAATAISDSNNPYHTGREELEEHFGTSTGGSNVVAFINPAETPETEALTDFDAVPDNFIRSGANTDIPENLPNVPGRIVGRTNGVWVVEWRWIPANYILFNHLDAPAPLMMRKDPEETGLGEGLQLVAEEELAPLKTAHWRHRFGVGAGNRLNGVVMELGTGGTYTIPTAYQ